jgi:hypothetical protein
MVTFVAIIPYFVPRELCDRRAAPFIHWRSALKQHHALFPQWEKVHSITPLQLSSYLFFCNRASFLHQTKPQLQS